MSEEQWHLRPQNPNNPIVFFGESCGSFSILQGGLFCDWYCCKVKVRIWGPTDRNPTNPSSSGESCKRVLMLQGQDIFLVVKSLAKLALHECAEFR
jgi:hypothetical protein